MASTYVPVRLATLIILGVLLIMSIVGLIEEIDRPFRDNKVVVNLSIFIAVTFLGAYGSWKHHRASLITFALLLIANIVINALAQRNILYASTGMGIVLLILALTQAELIKRGYH